MTNPDAPLLIAGGYSILLAVALVFNRGVDVRKCRL